VMNEVFNGERDLHMLEKRTIVEWIEDFHLPEIIVLELLEWCVCTKGISFSLRSSFVMELVKFIDTIVTTVKHSYKATEKPNESNTDDPSCETFIVQVGGGFCPIREVTMKAKPYTKGSYSGIAITAEYTILRKIGSIPAEGIGGEAMGPLMSLLAENFFKEIKDQRVKDVPQESDLYDDEEDDL